ncbi:MAG: hypothetical protein Q4F57_07895 [Weeksellaceae bacterium]|nr:hypothetical protein [Weeksellaceae bacterium]
MKNLLAIGVILILFISCDSPQKATENFLTAIQQKDFEKARNYTTEGSEEFLVVMEEYSSSQAIHHHFEVLHCAPREEGSEVITCIYRVKNASGSDFEKELDLVNVKGKWKVSLE